MAGDDPAATTEQPTPGGGASDRASALSAGLVPTIPARLAPDPRTAARAHLRVLRHASAELAHALMAAGYPPQRWQAPDPTLRELARDLPQPTLAALFARFDRFSGEDGPTWLAGDSAAIAAFVDEAHLLDDILRPLRALALRRRAGSPPDHPARPLERILAGPSTGVQLDLLAQAAGALIALAPALLSAPAEAAPRLVPVFAPDRREFTPRAPVLTDPSAVSQSGALASPGASPGASPTPSAPSAGSAPSAAPVPSPADAPTMIAEDAPTIPAEMPVLPGAVVGSAGDRAPAAGPPVAPDAPTVPWLPADATVPLPPGKVPRSGTRHRLAALPALLPRLPLPPFRRRRTQLVVALGIAACLACAVASIVLTFAPVSGPSAQATATARATQARPRPTITPIPATSTPLPAHLAVAPTFVNLACPFTGAPSTFTLRDTGGVSLAWRIANPPLTVFFSATSGTLAPGASVAVQVRAVLRQHGTHSFTVASNGGSAAVSYTVCH